MVKSLRSILEASVADKSWEQVLVAYSCVCNVCRGLHIRIVLIVERATEDSVLHVSHLLLHHLDAVLRDGD
jgi:hypothetical protein